MNPSRNLKNWNKQRTLFFGWKYTIYLGFFLPCFCVPSSLLFGWYHASCFSPSSLALFLPLFFFPQKPWRSRLYAAAASRAIEWEMIQKVVTEDYSYCSAGNACCHPAMPDQTFPKSGTPKNSRLMFLNNIKFADRRVQSSGILKHLVRSWQLHSRQSSWLSILIVIFLISSKPCWPAGWVHMQRLQPVRQAGVTYYYGWLYT